MQSHVWNIACPGDNVTWGGHMLRQDNANLQDKKKSPSDWMGSFFVLKPGSDLLSHGNSHTIIG
ncbi:hypothetical protein C9940_03785, partial [Pseudidiomarina aestuarii]